LRLASSSTKTQTHHLVNRAVRVIHQVMTAQSRMKTRNLMKTTLAATLTPSATHHLDAARVTRELLEQHLNQKRRSTSIRDSVQTVSKSSLALRGTFHGLLSTYRFLFQLLLPSTNSANTTVPVEMRSLLSILTVPKRGSLGKYHGPNRSRSVPPTTAEPETG
jgi:hypothetical protein